MAGDDARIRPCRAGDLDDLYRICLQTADNGQDATALFRDPRLPGHVYVAPYVTLEPSLAFVAEDAAGAGGYVVAALDSQAFEQRLERDWWPALRATYPDPLRDQGSRGLHLLVGDGNQNAVGFYRHLGFAEASSAHVHTFTMDLQTAKSQRSRGLV